MKTFTKYILQKMLGLHTYLYVFALFILTKIKWDKKEKDFFFFLKLLPEKGIVLDLGANIGVTSYHLAKKLPQSIIYSFEPLEINMNVLKRIKKKFSLHNIREFQLAAGNENKKLEMVMPVIGRVPMHGLSHAIHKNITENNSGLHFHVPMIKLDDFNEFKSTPLPLTGFKIDVENYEYFVIKGAEQLIKEHHPVIYCELWDNQNRRNCIRFLKSLGYSTFVLHKKELVAFNSEKHQKHNFFFIHVSNQ
jgi:FkbM family methyltransferase